MIRRSAGGGDGERWARDSKFHRERAGPGIRHRLGDGHGVWPRPPAAVHFDEALVFGRLAADTGAGYNRSGFAQLWRPFDPAVANGLAARDHRELGEAVQHVRGFGIEVIDGVVIANLRGGGEAHIPRRTAGFRILEGARAVASEP